jgi:hypothetical protein
MGTALLWVLSLASALLLVAAVMAFTGTLKRFQIRIILPTLSALAPLLAGVGAMVFAYKLSGPELLGFFGYMVSWTFIYLAGAVYILMRGLSMIKRDPAACVRIRGKLAAWFGIVLAICFCVLLILDNTIQIKLAVIRSEALSVALALQPPQVSDHLNASLIYEKAFKAMEEEKLPDWWEEIAEPAFDSSKGEVREFLEGKKGALTLLQRAASMPEYYVRVDYLKGKVPRLIPYKNAASLLALDARYKAANGEIDASFQNIAAIRLMAAQLKNTPAIMAVMIAAAVQQTGTRTVENILSEGQPISAGVVEKPVHYPVGLHEAFIHALRMDEALMAFTSTSRLSIHSIDWWIPLGDRWYRPLFLYDELTTARKIILDAHTIAAKPYYKSVEDWKRWDKSAKSSRGIMAAISVPFYGRRIEINLLEAEAGVGLTNLALATSAYHAEHAAYPGSLEDLTPNYISHIPTDPFSGKPLKMASVEGGLILYSIGPDLRDDGGIKEYDCKLKSKEVKPGDITFVMGTAFEDLRLKPSGEYLQKRGQERELRTKKRKK